MAKTLENKINFSVVLPTRGRRIQALASLLTLKESAASPDEIEFIIVLDDDDPDIGFWKNINIFSNYRLILTPRFGYYGLHKYINLGASKARGTWIAPWTDDCYMQTSNWDSLILLECKREFILSFYDNSNFGRRYSIDNVLVPFIRKEIYLALGHISNHYSFDTYIDLLGHPLSLIYKNHKFQITHLGMDEPYRSLSNEQRKNSFSEKIKLNEIQSDRKALISYFGIFFFMRMFVKRIPANVPRITRMFIRKYIKSDS